MPTLGREPRSIVDLARKRSAETPAKRAYSFHSDTGVDTALTYAELDASARAVAAGLRDARAEGERALLIYPPGLDFVAALLGCFYAGVVAVPAYPPRERTLGRLLSIAADSRPRFGLTLTSRLPEYEALGRRHPELETLRWRATDGAADPGDALAPAEVGAESLALLQYTSGSTGSPKGVMVSHGNLLHNEELIRRAFDQSEDSVVVGWLPLYHDMGLIGNVLQPLYSGSTAVLMSPLGFLRRPVTWLAAVSRHRATTSGGPNFAYEHCLRRIREEDLQGLDLSSWRVAFNGAEPVRAATLERFAARFAPYGFRREAFLPCYGLAEATLFVAGNEAGSPPRFASFEAEALARHRARAAEPGGTAGPAVRELVSSGRVGSGQEVAIVDPERGRRAAEGEIGEIWVRGPSVARGYWNQPDATARDFAALLAEDEDGASGAPFLRTGDLGFVHAGELYVTGRLKELIILRGRNHYPQDIEQSAERAHPALVAGCLAAFAVEREDEERLVVVGELGRHFRGELEEVVEAVRRAVAEEHEVQAHEVVLIRTGSLPKTTSGKIRRRRCRELLLQGELPVIGRDVVAEAASEAPARTPSRRSLLDLEPEERSRRLAQILRERVARSLRIEPRRIAPSQPLTAFGLDSLQAVEIQHAIEESLEVELPVQLFLGGASLERLVAELGERMAAETAPALPRSADVDAFPLSYMQRTLWFEQQLAPRSAAYNITFAARLGAGTDVPALRRALGRLIARHPVLRVTVELAAGEPVQRVHPSAAFDLTKHDVSGEEEPSWFERVVEEAHAPFDLEQGPLMRAALFERSPAERVLLFVFHHLICDGASLWIFLDELRRAYAAALAGREPSWPALSHTYRDFVSWQAELMAGPERERLERFWITELGGALPVLELPFDRPRPARPTLGADARPVALASSLVRPSRSLARERGSTLYAILLGAYQVLLSRYSGQSVITVGTATSGRSRPELAGVVGCFFNAVPMVGDLSGDPSFRAFLGQVQDKVAGALEHQDYPSHLLAERLGAGHAVSGAPLFRTHLIYHQLHRLTDAVSTSPERPDRAVLDLGGLVLEAVPVVQRTARSDLELELVELGDVVSGWFRFSTDLFEGTTLERMANQYPRLVREILERPGTPVSDLSLLSEAERRVLVEDWSHTGKSYALAVRVEELFEEQAARTPDHVAAVHGERYLTYRGLDRRAELRAVEISALEGPVWTGLMVEPGLGLPTGFLAILKSGRAVVPLDPDLPVERLVGMIGECGATLVVTEEKCLAEASELARECAGTVFCLDGDRLRHAAGRRPEAGGSRKAPGAADSREPDSREPLYLIFTSGSTGRPKGVPITHRNLVPLLRWSRSFFGFGAESRVLQSLSFGFDFGIFEILTTVLFGGTLRLLGSEGRRDAGKFPELIRRFAVNTLHTTPSFFRAVAEAVRDGGELATIEVLHLGGEPLADSLVRRAFELVGDACVIFNGYGPTETSINCAIFAFEHQIEGRETLPIGRASANNVLFVVDARLRLVPVGIAGELAIGGAGLSWGYLGRPALAAAKFVPNPFSTDDSLPDDAGERLYLSGDLVRYRSDGQIEFLRRGDHQVKIRGYRIEPGEIEAVLRQHPDVDEALVVARREGGASEAYLVAYLTVRHRAQIPDTDLKDRLRRRLPEYMVPAFFVTLDEWPTTATGKLDRRRLPAPDRSRLDLERAYVGPRTPSEEILVEILSELLGIERVGVYDSFFELGGHSLLATRFLAHIREQFEVDLPLRVIFENPRIAYLAVTIEEMILAELEEAHGDLLESSAPVT